MAELGSFGLDIGIYGPLATPDLMVEVAETAERRGFGAVWLADHVAFPVSFASQYPYAASGALPTRMDDPLMEPVAAMAVIAGATKRVRIGTAVLVMPYRHPLLLARMLVTIDQFSGGRVILGAGTGWLAEEAVALGNADFDRRGRQTDEAIEVFKAVAAGGEVGYRGETVSFEPVFSNPGSVQRPHPPVLVGGVSEPALRRVARLADGWIAVSVPPDRLAGRVARLGELCAERGRRLEDLQLAYKLFLSIDRPQANQYGGREPGTGSIAEIIDDLKALRDLGIGHFIVRYRGAGADEQRRQIARLADEIVPKV